MLLVGINKTDTSESTRRAADKIVKLRVFEDKNGKMNLDLFGSGGKILSVPQFTLCASTDKGNRPSFDAAGSPEQAERLWLLFNEQLRSLGADVEEGFFGAHMAVSSVNDGPVTFVLDI